MTKKGLFGREEKSLGDVATLNKHAEKAYTKGMGKLMSSVPANDKMTFKAEGGTDDPRSDRILREFKAGSKKARETK